jgi:hypothetical protein
MLLSFMSPLGEIFLVREQLKVGSAKLVFKIFLRLKNSDNSTLNLPFSNFVNDKFQKVDRIRIQ